MVQNNSSIVIISREIQQTTKKITTRNKIIDVVVAWNIRQRVLDFCHEGNKKSITPSSK